MSIASRIVPCLWFDGKAEEAARFYTSIFPRSRIGRITRYGEAGFEQHRHAPGTVMTVSFVLDGQPFTALDGGPDFRFNEAISLEIVCETQEEVDHYWSKLSRGGDPNAQQCGWLKDRFGVSWQVVPRILHELVGDPESPKSEAAMKAMMEMKKLDAAALERAYEQASP